MLGFKTPKDELTAIKDMWADTGLTTDSIDVELIVEWFDKRRGITASQINKKQHSRKPPIQYWLPRLSFSNDYTPLPKGTKIRYKAGFNNVLSYAIINGKTENDSPIPVYTVKSLFNNRVCLVADYEIVDIAVPTPKWLKDIFKLVKEDNLIMARNLWAATTYDNVNNSTLEILSIKDNTFNWNRKYYSNVFMS